MKTLVILQARMSSSRMPGKVMEIINGKPMIFWQIARVKLAKKVNKILVATSSDQTDDFFSEYLVSENIEVYRGSLSNVHSRYLEIIQMREEFRNIVRLTGDCPLVMPEIIDSLVAHLEENSLDYVSNTNPPTYPDGLDVEVFTREAFLAMSELPLSTIDLEHVTPKFYENQGRFKSANFMSTSDFSEFRWTVDYPEDLHFIAGIFREFVGRECDFKTDDILNLLASHPELNNQLPATLRNVSLNKSRMSTNE